MNRQSKQKKWTSMVVSPGRRQWRIYGVILVVIGVVALGVSFVVPSIPAFIGLVIIGIGGVMLYTLRKPDWHTPNQDDHHV